MTMDEMFRAYINTLIAERVEALVKGMVDDALSDTDFVTPDDVRDIVGNMSVTVDLGRVDVEVS